MFCRADSKLLEENLSSEKFTVGLGMTKIHCGFHGNNLSKNGVWRRCVFNSENENYWTGDKEPNPRECKHPISDDI